jgi:predicted metalloprotease with PDZ domain
VLITGIEGIVRRATALFGRAPYRDYTFLFQDAAFGALEHANSVTLGIRSSDLAANPSGYFTEIAHEYFHTWNILRIHPAEYGDVSYRTPPRSSGLWWSEGATMFYADLLVRRASLPPEDSSRVAHLARLLGDYYTRSGNHLLSPERVSRAAYGLQGTQLGDNTGSTHLQGELITAVLDLMVRNSTHDRRSIDDVMRAMMEHYSGARGFTSDDVSREVARVCGCATAQFFAAHVHGSASIDVNRYLALIGLTSRVAWTPALTRDGLPQPDLRAFAWQAGADSALRLMVLDTASVWEHAGLHTGDRILSINGRPVTELATFRSIVASLHIGDSVHVDVRRARGGFHAALVVTGYQRAVVTIEERPDATPAERMRRDKWLRGS